MKQVLYELYKILNRKSLLIAILLLLIFNIWRLNSVTSELPAEYIKNLFERLEGPLTDETYSWISQEYALVSAISNAEAKVHMESTVEGMAPTRESLDEVKKAVEEYFGTSQQETIEVPEFTDEKSVMEYLSFLEGKYAPRLWGDNIALSRVYEKAGYVREWPGYNQEGLKRAKRIIGRNEGVEGSEYLIKKWTRYVNMYGSLREPHLYYTAGWEGLFRYTDSSIIIVFLILFGLAPLFSAEYSEGTDRLLLSSKYGRSNVVIAKLSAAVIYIIFLSLVFIAVDVGAFGIKAGFPGWNNSLQGMEMFVDSPYNITAGQYLVLFILFKLAGNVAFGVAVLFVSSLFKSSLLSFAAGGALFGIPLMSGMLANVRWAEILNSFGYNSFVSVNGFFDKFTCYNIFGQPVLYLELFIGLFTILTVLFLAGTFCNYLKRCNG